MRATSLSGERRGRLAKLATALLLVAALTAAVAQGGGEEEEGLFPAVPLSLNEWTRGTCGSNGWKDYTYTVDASDEKANLHFEVQDITNELRMDVIGLHVVARELPARRQTLGSSNVYGIDNIYSRTISYQEVEATTYYVMVRCQGEPVPFLIRASKTNAVLASGATVSGEVCPDEWLYHKINVTEEDWPQIAGQLGGDHHVRLRLAVTEGDITAITASDHPPLFLYPPVTHVSELDTAAGGPAELHFCNVKEGHAYYIGVVGTGRTCASYTVSASYVPGGECHAAETDSHADYQLAKQMARTPELQLRRFSRGHLEAHQTADYRFNVADGAHYNMLAILKDEGLGFNPTAMSLRLYKGTIPSDRRSEYYSERAVDGLYSLGINAWDLAPGDYYLSVSAGPLPVDYSLVIQDVSAELHEDGGAVQGEVCPGAVTFHYYDTPADAEGRNIRFRLRLHSGEAYYYTRTAHPPLKMIPPYQHVTAQEQAGGWSEAAACATEADTRTYLAIKATDACAIYDVSVEVLPVEEECHSMQHMCIDDCRVLCEELEVDHRQRDSCSPGEIKRYMITLTEEQAAGNLEIQVEDRSNRLLPSALLLQHFEGAIPADFKTQRFASHAPNRVLSVTISSWDLQAGRHYILVTCNPTVSAEFFIYTHLSPAQLMPHHVASGDLCPGDWFHYSVGLDADGKAVSRTGSSQASPAALATGAVVAHVKFTTWLHMGGAQLITRQGAAPLKLVPPYHTTTALEQEHAGVAVQQGLVPSEVWHCNATAGQVYIGLRGFQDCASFDLTVEVLPAADGLPEACQGGAATAAHRALPSADAALERTISGMPSLRFGHATLASCEPGSYQDFYIEVGAGQDREFNLNLSLEDLTNPANPTALSLLLFKGAIPKDRRTEHVDTMAEAGEYSLLVSAWDFHPGHYFVSVKCGANPADFRLLPTLSKVELASGERTSGAVCPGDQVLHRLDATALRASAGKHLTWSLTMHSGDAHVMLSEDAPQLRLVAPYLHVAADASSAESVTTRRVSACDIERVPHYIALRGGDECVEYDIMPEVHDGEDCAGVTHQPPEYIVDNRLTAGEFLYGSCDAFGVKDYLLFVDEGDSGKNLEITVQDLASASTVPDSLGVYLYDGGIPVSRSTEEFDEFSSEGVFSVSVSANDLVGPRKYFVSVKCRLAAAKFRILPMLTESELLLGHPIHGEVCTGDWAHHFYAPRRDEVDSDEATHLRFTLDVFTGESHFLSRPDTAPISLSPPFRWADVAGSRPYALPQGGHTRYITDVCNLAASGAERHYLALRGGSACMVYNVHAELWRGDGCEQPGHDSQLQLSTGAEELHAHRMTRGSCQAGSWKDYYFDISEEEESLNVALAVEDLTNADNPDALEVHLYRRVGAVPQPRRPDMATSAPRLGVYSLAMDEVNVNAGRYFLSVRCRSDFVRFRVNYELVDAVLRSRQNVGGYVVPSTWAYHYFEPEEAEPHFTFEITLFSGSLYLLSTRLDYPPSFTAMAAATYMQIVDQAAAGEAGSYSVTVCGGAGRRHYVGLFGGDAMATYIIHAAPFAGDCETGGEDEGYIDQSRAASSAIQAAVVSGAPRATQHHRCVSALMVAAAAWAGALLW